MTESEQNAVNQLKMAIARVVIDMDDELVLKCINKAIQNQGNEQAQNCKTCKWGIKDANSVYTCNADYATQHRCVNHSEWTGKIESGSEQARWRYGE